MGRMADFMPKRRQSVTHLTEGQAKIPNEIHKNKNHMQTRKKP